MKNDEVYNQKLSSFDTLLSGHQIALYEHLKKLDERLAQMYYGALEVLNGNDNPERFYQSAHSLRELIEKLPSYIGVSQNSSYILGNRVNNLKEKWKKIKKHEYSKDEEQLIDNNLCDFLNEMNCFFVEYENERPTRNEEFVTTLKIFEKSNGFLPDMFYKNWAKKWAQLKDFFTQLSHHRFQPVEKEYYQRLNEFELFLAEKIAPRTFENLDDMDSIIIEGEKID